MPTLQIEDPSGGWTAYNGETLPSATAGRRFRVLNLGNSVRSEELPCEGFSLAHFLVDTITSNPSSDTFVDLVAMTDGGFESGLMDVEGTVPWVLFRRARVTSAGARSSGWLVLPPANIKLVCFNAAADFDVIVELLRTPVAT